jgi:hypothetical protein
MQAWFYCKVPLLRSPSPVRGKGIFALHSYMTGLDFATEPPFECPTGDAGDVAFVKATHSIGGRDACQGNIPWVPHLSSVIAGPKKSSSTG